MQRYTILAEFKNNFSSVVYQYVKERLVYVIGYPQGAPLHWANTSVRPYGCYYVDMSSYSSIVIS